MTETTPKLRFPEFTAPWRPARGGDAFHNSRARGEDGLPIYSVTLDRGLVPRSSLERHLSADAADEQNLRAQPDDLVYNTMRMWQGAVGRADVECMVSPAYVVLSPKKGVSSAFFNEWFKHPRMRHLLGAYSHGLTSDRLRLYADDFAQIPMALPEPAEQERIAAALGQVDRKIALLRERRDALERFKSGTSDRIFRREIRFTRDDGTSFPEWRRTRVGDLYDWVPTNSLSREYLTTDVSLTQNIHYGDIHRRLRTMFRQRVDTVSYVSPSAAFRPRDVEFCRLGDVVIADASEDVADIGKLVEIVDVTERPLVAGLHTILARPKTGAIVLGFGGYMLSSAPARRQIERLAQGVSVFGISKSGMAAVEVGLPSREEQAKITATLMALDAKIEAVGDQVENISAFRRGLIQRLFP